MKKKHCRTSLVLLCGMILAVCLLGRVDVSADSTVISAEGNIIVLLDASKSMKNDIDEALRWVYDIASLCKDTDITLTVYTFRSQKPIIDQIPECLLDHSTITEDTLQELGTALQNVAFDGEGTDQYEAIQVAEDCIKEEELDESIVVLISDGDLDYVCEEYQDDEEEAIESFKETCEKLAEDGNWIYMVEFERDVDVFHWEEDELENERIQLIPKDSSVETILQHVFEQADLEVDVVEGKVEEPDTSFSFQLDETYERVVINIASSENLSKNQEYAVYYELSDEEKEKLDATVVQFTKTAYIYLEYPAEGNYLVNLEGLTDVDYSVNKVSKITSLAGTFTWLDGNSKKLKKNSDDNGLLSETADIIVKIEITSDDFDVEDITKFCYEIGGTTVDVVWEESDGKSDSDMDEDSSSDSALESEEESDLDIESESSEEKMNLNVEVDSNVLLCRIEGLSPGNNKCIIKMEIDDGAGTISDTKYVLYEPADTDEDTIASVDYTIELTEKVNKEFYLVDTLNESGFSYDIEKLQVELDGEMVELGSKNDTFEMKETLYMTFYEKGEYELMLSQNGSAIQINITVKGSGVSFNGFIDLIKGIPEAAWIVVAVIIIIIIIIVFILIAFFIAVSKVWIRAGRRRVI